jgi:hypothetical protein
MYTSLVSLILTAVPIFADPGYSLSISRDLCVLSDQSIKLEPPANISMSHNGRYIAFVETLSAPRCGEDRIVIISPRGRFTIDRPRPDVPSSQSSFYSVSALRISDTGALFATLNERFAGAYMGNRKTSYEFIDHKWSLIEFNGYGIDNCPENLSIAALSADRGVAVEMDCDAVLLPSLEEHDDPQYAPQSGVIIGHRGLSLGPGVVFDLRGAVAAGTGVGLSYSGRPTVLLWRNGKRSQIGLGAGFSVDADNDVVGDDRVEWDSPGRPSVWIHRHLRHLSSLHGSAFAILNGLIVGSLDGRAFYTKLGTRQICFFKKAAQGAISPESAFAISTSGTALAVGRRKDGNFSLIVFKGF